MSVKVDKNFAVVLKAVALVMQMTFVATKRPTESNIFLLKRAREECPSSFRQQGRDYNFVRTTLYR